MLKKRDFKDQINLIYTDLKIYQKIIYQLQLEYLWAQIGGARTIEKKT